MDDSDDLRKALNQAPGARVVCLLLHLLLAQRGLLLRMLCQVLQELVLRIGQVTHSAVVENQRSSRIAVHRVFVVALNVFYNI